MIEKPKAIKVVWDSSKVREKFEAPQNFQWAIQEIMYEIWDRIPFIARFIINKWLSKPEIRLICDEHFDGRAYLDPQKQQIKINVKGIKVEPLFYIKQKIKAELIYNCAHEFGHAYWLAIIEQMTKIQNQNRNKKSSNFLSYLIFNDDMISCGHNTANHEIMANALAISWGFLPEMAKGCINDSHFEDANKKRISEPGLLESFNLNVDIVKAAKILKRIFPKRF